MESSVPTMPQTEKRCIWSRTIQIYDVMKYENCLLSNWEATAAGLQYCCSPLYPEPDDCFPEEAFIKEKGHMHLYWTYRSIRKKQIHVCECGQRCKTRVGGDGSGLWGQHWSTHPLWPQGNHQIISCCLRVWAPAWRKVNKDVAVSLHT